MVASTKLWKYIKRVADNSPKHSVQVWTAIRQRFEAGSFVSLKELASEYSVNPVTLRTRMLREKWNDKQRTLQNKVELAVEKKILSKAESYLERTTSRMERYEKIIDASIENLGSKTPDGTPLLDPEAIDQYTRSETRLKDISAFCYRLAAPVQVNHTGSIDLNHSLVQTIERLRSGKDCPDLTPEDKAKLIDVEVLPKPSPNHS